jgi:hypothetical protein
MWLDRYDGQQFKAVQNSALIPSNDSKRTDNITHDADIREAHVHTILN